MYLFASGRLRRKENTVCVETEEQVKYFPVENIRDIYVFGEVDLNKKLLEFFHQNEIILHFFDHYGHYIGSFYPREHYNSGYMILKQAEHYLDFEKRLFLAQQFVAGSLANIIQVLKYYANRDKEVNPFLEAIDEFASNLANCHTIEELMAIEGNARNCYYESFKVILEDCSFAIDRRSKRPPTDPLNALISFGNSLVYAKVLTEI